MKRVSPIWLSVATLAGCGDPSPPPAAPAPAIATVTAAAPAAGVYGDPSEPVAGRVLGTVVHRKTAGGLRYVALKTLTDRYADSKGIAVTRAEQDAYVAQLREAPAKDPAMAAELGRESAEDAAAGRE